MAMIEDDVSLQSVLVPSDDIVAREIEDELIIVPLAAGIGDADDELYTLNETGREVWVRLDGQATLGQIADELFDEFNAPLQDIQAAVLGFAREMAKRRILAPRV